MSHGVSSWFYVGSVPLCSPPAFSSACTGLPIPSFHTRQLPSQAPRAELFELSRSRTSLALCWCNAHLRVCSVPASAVPSSVSGSWGPFRNGGGPAAHLGEDSLGVGSTSSSGTRFPGGPSGDGLGVGALAGAGGGGAPFFLCDPGSFRAMSWGSVAQYPLLGVLWFANVLSQGKAFGMKLKA